MDALAKQSLRINLRHMRVDELREIRHEVEQVIQEKRGIVNK